MSKLSEKLKALGVQQGVSQISSPPPKKTGGIESAVNGHVIATHFGETFVVEEYLPADYRYGKTCILPIAPLHTISGYAGSEGLAEYSKEQFVFLDTETSGLAGGTGTFAFMVGLGRFEGDTFHLAQFFMRDPLEEAALLEAVQEFLAPCQVLVTYNGKSFDAPLLNARFTLHGMGTPLKETIHLDLLHLARRLWRQALPSRTLGSVETSILGVERTQDEVPGYLVPQYYFDYLRTGDASLMSGVFYHNAMDVIALAALFSHTIEMLANPIERVAFNHAEMFALARLMEELKYEGTSIRLYENSINDLSTPEEIRIDALERLSYLHKRNQHWEEAVPLWEQAAQHHQVWAFEELAKFYEHTVKDPSQALAWCEESLNCVQGLALPRYEKRQLEKQIHHRIERLQKKLHRE